MGSNTGALFVRFIRLLDSVLDSNLINLNLLKTKELDLLPLDLNLKKILDSLDLRIHESGESNTA